jgi:diguanylate cyclase (GGDEF)-like protein/PAS domain S-box-containing protein
MQTKQSIDTSIVKIADFVSQHHEQEPFNAVVTFAAKHFEVDYVHIGLLQDDAKSVKIVAGYLDGEQMEPGYVYSLPGTPCEHVVEHDHKCYLAHVRELFPEDHDLSDLHAEGYIGEPINDSSGNAIGLIVLVSRVPLKSSRTLTASMRILAGYLSNIITANEMREKVRLERDNFLNIMQTVDTVIVLLDLDGNITMINKKGHELLGYDEGELSGKNWFTTCVPQGETSDTVRAVHNKVPSGDLKATEYFENEVLTKTGERRTIAWHNSIVHDSHGNIIGGLAAGNDITEQNQNRKLLEENEALLNTVINQIPDILVVKDEKANFVLANDAVAKLYGATPESMIGKDDADFGVPKEMSDFFRQNVLEIMAKGEMDIVYEDSRDADTGEIHHFKSIKRPFKTVDGKDRILVIAQDITDLITTQEELEKSRDQLEAILQTTRDAFWLIDQGGKLLDVNQAVSDMNGYSREELLKMSIADIDATEDPIEVRARMQEVHDKGFARFESVHQHKNGSLIDVDVSITSIPTQGFYVAFIRDITKRKQFENQLKESEESFRSLFDSLQESVYVQDENGTFLAVNEGAVKMYGHPKAWFVGKSPLDVSAPGMNDLEALVLGHQRVMAGEPQSFEFWALRADGSIFPKEVHQTKGTWFGQDVVFAVALDISERKKHEQQLQHIAHYDALTGLPNRLLLADRLQQAMLQAKRQNRLLAIAYLDLDGFKEVNDTHGHDIGDRLLISISKRLKKALREGDTLSRLGGDEFVLILVDFDHYTDSIPVLERLLEAVVEPDLINGSEMNVSASIGVTFFPQSDVIDADQLIRQSDQAMYEAKQSGKNRFHIFDAQHERDIRGHHKSLAHIGNALSQGEFVLFYQPKVNLRSGELIGVEALIRWQHPQSGLLPPAAFLPTIEHHSLSIEVGEWVLEEALSQIEIWKTKGVHTPISVNIDGLHLQQFDFVERLKAMLTRHPEVRSGDLELEVLETSALEDIAQVSDVIESCREIGITFALDDFGTGYSSLTYLKRLPADMLKIDKSFVIDMLDDPEDLAILDGVLGLANVFGRNAIAEGIETIEHAEMLLRMGCDLAQGYAIAKPMPAEAFEQWKLEWRPQERWQEINALERDDLSALYAIAEHRAWSNKLIAHLNNATLPIPKLDMNACQFIKWFTKFAMHHPEHAESLSTIETIHETIHTLAKALIDDNGQIDTQEKHRRIEVLQQHKEDLVETILKLVDE